MERAAATLTHPDVNSVTMALMPTPSTLSYFLADYPRTLFPLQTNAIVLSNAGDSLNEHVYQRILGSNSDSNAFLPQQSVFSAKPNWHLRKTVKLDPVAEYFIYDLTFRNRRCFRRPFQQHRRNFGYRFEEGAPVTVDEAYKMFRRCAPLVRRSRSSGGRLPSTWQISP